MAGWSGETAVLSCFPPMKEAMYQDLLEHEDLAAAHPAVQALAGDGRATPSARSWGNWPAWAQPGRIPR